MINTLADKYLYKIEDFLPGEINLTLYDPQQTLKPIPDGTQALLIRTTTPLTPGEYTNLPSSLEFAATASAGTDHVDISWLKARGITFADAAGCNARAVAEYVATALLIWADTKSMDYAKLTVGIIGVGHTGSKVKKLLEGLGVTTVSYDPPRGKREKGFTTASLNEVLACDILTFHTPLTFDSDYPTYHWLDENKLAGQHFKLIINASRGGVVNEKALLDVYKNKGVEDYILDVWENEPLFKDEAARNAFIKTPHIAGYSKEAKHNASTMVANAFCEYFSLKRPLNRPSQEKEMIDIPFSVSSLSELLKYLHPICEYDGLLSKLITKTATNKREGFSRIRTAYPLRNEYLQMRLPSKLLNQFPILTDLF